MPIIQMWIRDEDYPGYLEIKKGGRRAWSEFVHLALISKENPQREVESQEMMKAVTASDEEEITSPEPLEEIESIFPGAEVLEGKPITKGVRTCKNGHIASVMRGNNWLCMTKGCQYARPA